ncbi:MAG: hypothetical protein ACLTDM_09885 [Clostridium butyricum]
MKENREEYQVKITKEIKNKLQLDMNKEYSIDEINELLDKHNMRGGILQFVPTKPHSAQKIIDTLVYMDMRVTDAIHKEMGLYEDKTKCEYCNNYFDEETERMFQVRNQKDSPLLCEKCRREFKLKIDYADFRRFIPNEEKENFINEELEFGIDYSDYIERFNKNKK